MNNAKFYLAASFADKERMRTIRDALLLQEHQVTATWMDQGGSGLDVTVIQDEPGLATKHAVSDFGGIYGADVVAVFTGMPSTTGGLQVEFGIALGLDKPICLIGPVLNIFMTLPTIRRYNNDEDFLAFTAGMKFNFGVIQET